MRRPIIVGNTRPKKRRQSKMRTRKKRLCIPAILAVILIILSTCSTTPPAPPVDPSASLSPGFLDPWALSGAPVAVLDLEAGTVTVPLAYWFKIAEYVVDVEKVRETYEGWREVYLAP
jgi:hypothetical protein